jgi:hypothetical protein
VGTQGACESGQRLETALRTKDRTRVLGVCRSRRPKCIELLFIPPRLRRRLRRNESIRLVMRLLFSRHSPLFILKRNSNLVCGLQRDPRDMRLTRGAYATTIIIHNPNEGEVKFSKKLAFTFPLRNKTQARLEISANMYSGPIKR